MNPCQKLRQALAAEKAPYIITVAFAGLAWTVTHTVQRLETIPVLEYTVSGPNSGTSGKLVYTVTNLSQQTFRNIYLYVQPARDRNPKLSAPVTEYESPGMANPLYDRAATMDSDTAAFPIAELQPGWAVKLMVEAKTDEARLIYYTGDDEKIGVQPFRLLESGFMTWLVNDEFGILVGIIGIWLLLIFVFALIL